MRKLLTACLVMVACGRPIVSTCRAGPFDVESEVELDCWGVEHSVNLARRLYYSDVGPRSIVNVPDEQGTSFEDPWPRFSSDTFDDSFKETTIFVLDGETVECGTVLDPKHVGGCSKDGNIFLPSSHNLSFGHELMHVYECRVDGNCHNTKHEGWKDNGYENFGVAYAYGVTDGGMFASTLTPWFTWVPR